MITEIKLYQTEDGQTFNTFEEAEEYRSKHIKKKYQITYFYSGSETYTVEAFNEEEAMKKAEDLFEKNEYTNLEIYSEIDELSR